MVLGALMTPWAPDARIRLTGRPLISSLTPKSLAAAQRPLSSRIRIRLRLRFWSMRSSAT
jgi:hypothetical protein